MAPGCIYWSLPRGDVPSDGGAWGKEKVPRARVPNLFKPPRPPLPLPATSRPPPLPTARGLAGRRLPRGGPTRGVREPSGCQTPGWEPGALAEGLAGGNLGCD